MRILSFDTSTNELHLCLSEDGKIVDQLVVQEADDQTRQEAVAALMPAVVELLERAQWKKSEIECIVVGEGPGSFTGVRTGVVTARTMAQALELPILAVSLLDCYASLVELPAAIIISSGRGRYFVAGYESRRNSADNLGAPASAGITSNADSLFQMSVDPTSISESDLVQTLGTIPHWYGDAKAIAELKKPAVPPAKAALPEVRPLPHLENIASKQAQIAFDRLSLTLSRNPGNGAVANLLLETYPFRSVKPLYLRNPSITLKKPAVETT